MPCARMSALSARASASAVPTLSASQIMPARSLIRLWTLARTDRTVSGLSGRRTAQTSATPVSAARRMSPVGAAFARPLAAMCSAARVPKTWPAFSAAPPGRVTPWVPAASPTA